MITVQFQDGRTLVKLPDSDEKLSLSGWFHIAVHDRKCYVNGERHYVGIAPISSWPEWMVSNLVIRRQR